jgi:hypothetical protein
MQFLPYSSSDGFEDLIFFFNISIFALLCPCPGLNVSDEPLTHHIASETEKRIVRIINLEAYMTRISSSLV